MKLYGNVKSIILNTYELSFKNGLLQKGKDPKIEIDSSNTGRPLQPYNQSGRAPLHWSGGFSHRHCYTPVERAERIHSIKEFGFILQV